MDRPITLEVMMNYVGTQVQNLSTSLANLSSALDRHEQWHRDDLEHQLAQRQVQTSSRAGLVVQVVSAIASLAAVVVAIVALAHVGG